MFSTPGCVRKTPSRASRMFTLSTKSPPPKVPQPERLDEVYEALKRGLQYVHKHMSSGNLHASNSSRTNIKQFCLHNALVTDSDTDNMPYFYRSYLQVHQMELDGLNRQMKESKRNSRLVSFLCFKIVSWYK